MRAVLITGATGYVGREVARRFVREGYDVTALGRTRPDIPVRFLKADLTDAQALKFLPPLPGIEGILHIASLPGDTGDPRQMLDVNVSGCLGVLELARVLNAKIVIASSISAYEWYPATKFRAPSRLPVTEDMPCDPSDMYSTTKRMQELLMLTYFRQYSVRACALRLTAVVGPDGRGGGRGYRELAEQIAEGKQVRVPHFSEDELCHYVDIRDVAALFQAALERPAADGEIFNCCGPAPVRGHEFAAAVRAVAPGAQVEYGFPWSMAQGGELWFSMEKAKRLLGFEPQYTLADSIASIRAWIDESGLDSTRREAPGYTRGVEKEGEQA